jgi:Kef-type K+ transport system membrane component KefB/Trk K+ transport system NAD-binding subunit
MIILDSYVHFDYLPILVIAAIAWATPLVLSLVRMKKVPSVLVEIILGFVIVRSMISGLDDSTLYILDFLAQVGLIFLMFLSGLEIDMDQIIASFPRRRLTISRVISNPLIIGILYFGAALVLAYFSAFGLSYITDIPNVWYFSLIMVATSLGIVMPVLKERGDINSKYGQMIIIAASVSDFFGIVLFTFTAIILKSGLQVELLYIIGIFLLFYLAYRIGQKARQVNIIKKLVYQLSHAAAQIQVRGSILLILVFVVVAQFVGGEVVYLGAFLSGLILSTLLHRERSIILIKLDGMGFGFFIPFFFIMVGARFDASSFGDFNLSMAWFLLALFLSLYALNVIPAVFWRKLFGIRRALAGGFLMASRLSLVIVASAIGMSLGVITPEINASFILLAVATCFISPYLFNLIAPDATTEGGKTVIIGGSSTGVVLARKMKVHGKKVMIVEKNITRAEEIKQKGLNCIWGDGTEEKLYKEINLTSADYVVVDTGSERTNHRVSKILRNNLLHEKIISWSGTSNTETKLKNLGVQTIDLVGVMATTIENLILRPTTYHALVESFENFSVEEVMITSKRIDGMQVKDIYFHKDAILMMVKRDNSYYIPHGQTYFRTGDVLHVFGTNTALTDTRQKLTSA